MAADPNLLAILDTISNTVADTARLQTTAIISQSNNDKEMAMQDARISAQAESDAASRLLRIEGMNQDMANNWGIANLDKDPDSGLYQLKPDFDISQRPDIQVSMASNLVEQLNRHELPVDDDADVNQRRLDAFLLGKTNGTGLPGTTVSPSISLYTVDVTHDALTTHDLDSFEQFVDAAGYNDARVLSSFIGAGIINADDVYVDDTTGLYTTIAPGDTEEDQALLEKLNYGYMGFRKGVIDNERYLTDIEYYKYKSDETLKNMEFASKLTEHPTVVSATRVLNSTQINIAGHMMIGQTDDGEYTLKFGTKQILQSELHDEIDDMGDINDNDRALLKGLYSSLSAIGADGSGLLPILEELVSNPSKITLVGKVDPSLAKKLRTAVDSYAKIKQVENIAGNFIQTPESLDTIQQLTGIDKLLVDSGLKNSVLNTRSSQTKMNKAFAELEWGKDKLEEIKEGIATVQGAKQAVDSSSVMSTMYSQDEIASMDPGEKDLILGTINTYLTYNTSNLASSEVFTNLQEGLEDKSGYWVNPSTNKTEYGVYNQRTAEAAGNLALIGKPNPDIAQEYQRYQDLLNKLTNWSDLEKSSYLLMLQSGQSRASQ